MKKNRKVVVIFISIIVLVLGVSILQSVRLPYFCYPLWATKINDNITEERYVCLDGTSYTFSKTEKADNLINEQIDNFFQKEIGQEVVLGT